MKKYWKLLTTAIVVALASMLIVLAACTTNVAGKTFTYSEVTYEYNDDATTVQRLAVDAAVAAAKVTGKATASFAFTEDGTVSVNGAPAVSYTQDGDQVEILGVTYEARGGNLSLILILEGGTVTTVYTS